MAMDLTLRPATPEDLTWVERAVRRCPQTMAAMGGFYGAAATRMPPLLGPDRELLIVLLGTEPVGFLDLDTDRETSDGTDLTYFVVPGHRRRGVGLAALRALVAGRPDRRFVAAVRPDNLASLALARAAGFTQTGSDEWGDLVLVHRGPPSSAPGGPSHL